VLRQDAAVVVRGAVSGRERDEEDPPMFLDSALPLEKVREGGEVGLAIELGSSGPDPAAVQEAKALLAAHPGEGPVVVLWKNGGSEAQRLRSRTLKVAPGDELLLALRERLGDDRVRLHRDPPALGAVPQRDEPWRNRRQRVGVGAEE
jgi:DNA polymerase-3 subunit alpha